MIQRRSLEQRSVVAGLLLASTWSVAAVCLFGFPGFNAAFPPAGPGHAAKWIIAAALSATLMIIEAGASRLYGRSQSVPETSDEPEFLVDIPDAAGLAGSIAASSHELQTPLSAIIGLTTLLAQTSLNEDQARQVSALQTSAAQMFGLVADVLDLSRLDAGELTLVTETVDLDALLGQLHIIDTVGARGQMVRVVATREPDVTRYVMADRQRLTQILLGIVAHAAASGAAGFVTIRVEPGHDQGKDLLRFSFTAWEPGQAHDELGSVFTAFEHRRDAEAATSSLEPAMSVRLAALMGGTIRSEGVSPGTHLILDLPLAVAAAAVETTSGARACAPADAAPDNLKILVADDSPSGLHVMAMLLRRHGHDVVAVTNGVDAIEAARATAFDLCLLDLQMDGVSGIEAAAGIRALDAPNGTGAVYALSARIDAADSQACRLVSMDGCLVKPLLGEELTAVLNTVSHRRRRLEFTTRRVQQNG